MKSEGLITVKWWTNMWIYTSVSVYVALPLMSADLNVKNQYGITSLEAFMYGIQKNTL